MTGQERDGPPRASRAAARTAKATLRRGLHDLPGVAAIGVARRDEGGFGVVVRVRSADLADHIPDVVAGVPVEVRVVGEVRPRGG
ncbi:hypothetical protein Bcav_3935 [Beutenbergia cavernae DSM 12333]|uniref:Uncharacterized protein n=1 Tax=Beutenbergia cavernae (strain ATCC BAA-8 / DSM 12333 / CCUG 43141 / JCM 11478 / NBRC 16432 / NCIMB 13614 / HKI 0122) TaxID=471853 RepID=C5C536_BEUC1|nr:hypothetical protein [Beutenbergia cavernae]ACQ82176.1 hypothetical protein Bcav_3935 [Beutenbergia cavernae DSM 12333]